jgi:hypothetical protein
MYLWSLGRFTVEDIAEQTGVSMRHVFSWLKKIRKVLRAYHRAHPVKLGGPGVEVLLDEHFMTAKKGGRGRPVRRRGIWIFGMVERGSGIVVLKQVRRRTAAILVPLIQHYIRPGTTIFSDLWRAYRRLTLLPQGFRHLTVNHSINFVDPATGADTQLIENVWSRWVYYVRMKQGIHAVRSHLHEFRWRVRFGKRKTSVLHHLVQNIREQYPCHR